MTDLDGPLRTIDGDRVTDEHLALLRDGHLVRLVSVVRSAPPVDAGDVVELARPSNPAPGDVVLCRSGGDFTLRRLLTRRGAEWLARDERAGVVVAIGADAIAGVVVAVEQTDLRFELRRGRWRVCGAMLAMVPTAWGVLARVLARVERLRRPFFPPLFMGPPETLVAGVREAYEDETIEFTRTEGLNDEELVMLERYLRPGMRMLDVGCGEGREAIGFAAAGLDVTGLDVSAHLVTLARARAARASACARFEVGDPLTFEPAHHFDVIYLLTRDVYAHIPGRSRRVATLRRLAALLEPGGFVLFIPMLLEPPPLLSRARVVDILRSVLGAFGVSKVSEPGDGYHRGTVLRPWPRSVRYIHRFTDPKDIEREIEAAGLVVSDRLVEPGIWILRGALP